MSIEQNKKDFESALRTVKEEMSSLEKVLSLSLFEMIEHMIDEYDTHFVDDIETLISDNECLEEDLTIAEQQVAELLEEVAALEEETAELEERMEFYGN